MSGFISNDKLYIYNKYFGETEEIEFPGEGVNSVFMRDSDMLIIDNNLHLWGRGLSSFNKLGYDGRQYDNITFVQIPLPLNTVFYSVAIDEHYSIALDSNGNIWVTGVLGNEEFDEFTQVTENIIFTTIACNSGHILGIDNEGNLWGYGTNYDQELGINGINYVNNLQLIKGGSRFTTVDTSEGITICTDDQGYAWGCGNNLYTILGWDIDNAWEFKILTDGILVKDAFCSNSRIILLARDGRVFTCGYYAFGAVHSTEPLQENIEMGIGRYQEIAQGVTVDQIVYNNFDDTIILKDIDGNIWVGGEYSDSTYPFRILPDIKADSLINQHFLPRIIRRFKMTKRSEN